jgi:hypothetical protein
MCFVAVPMSSYSLDYEELLSRYSNHLNAVELLRQYRPYLETVPSMRRSEASLITIPLPIIQVRRATADLGNQPPNEKLSLPCDLAILMCDPEWQVKTDVEIFIFIHRQGEDFSDLLRRWRQTQILLSHDYSWDMPLNRKHIFSEGAEKNLPLFVLMSDSPPRIKRGLKGAGLPFVEEQQMGENSGDLPNSTDDYPPELIDVELGNDDMDDFLYEQLPDDPDMGSFLS